jgi:SPP1 family predicted phage head-tail adaptor
MRAGRLKHRIRFERFTSTINEYGEPVQVWTELDTVWSGVEPIRGAERFAAMQTQSDADVMIVTRWSRILGAITTADRIIFGDIVYDIKSVINRDFRNMEMNFMVKSENLYISTTEAPVVVASVFVPGIFNDGVFI